MPPADDARQEWLDPLHVRLTRMFVRKFFDLTLELVIAALAVLTAQGALAEYPGTVYVRPSVGVRGRDWSGLLLRSGYSSCFYPLPRLGLTALDRPCTRGAQTCAIEFSIRKLFFATITTLRIRLVWFPRLSSAALAPCPNTGLALRVRTPSGLRQIPGPPPMAAPGTDLDPSAHLSWYRGYPL